ncbi:L-amino acid amidase [Microbacterium oxydans]|uniref:proline iminopeptidase-family hydrolase n=1 Tax=Microbacterium oxydans TaxID=82380 RepID=UPI001DBADF28|nr:proline iminopeptidase-family hydrolase [Microbacterium oxydans]CAH0226068.1 L-amino acid amidase [Microbacterium oxydans]
MKVDETMPQTRAHREGRLTRGDEHTWYRVNGEIGDHPTVVVLHGGPGATHDYLLPLEALATPGRAVVLYDQVGSGRSSHSPDAPSSSWTVSRFLDELDQLLDELGIRENHVLFGQSWGGMLAAEHAVRRPPGLKGLIIANSPASMPLWMQAAEQLRSALPDEVQRTLVAHEAAGTTDSPEYVAAMHVYYRRHVCRIDPWPAELEATLAAIDADPTVYHTMNGPSEFHVTGSLRDWSIVDRLHAIDAPTLVLTGRYDEATPETVRPFIERIPQCHSVVLPDSSHMPHLEEPEHFRHVMGTFLDSLDSWSPSRSG